MKIIFSHIFIQVNINFNFSYTLYNYLNEKISALVTESQKFLKLHDKDYRVIFRISAKKELLINEIKGPSVYRKDKDIEFTIFLPYTPIMQKEDPNKNALIHLLQGVCEALEKYEIDTSNIKNKRKEIISEIMASPEMLEEP